MKIGLDFDNTIACYELVFSEVAKFFGLVDKNWVGTKKELREWLINRPGGELEWQKLQGLVYGRFMSKAELFPGVAGWFSIAGKSEQEICTRLRDVIVEVAANPEMLESASRALMERDISALSRQRCADRLRTIVSEVLS